MRDWYHSFKTTLSFPDFDEHQTEQSFWEKSDATKRVMRLVFMPVAIFIYGLFGLFDYLVLGDDAAALLIIRAITLWAMAIAFIAFCRSVNHAQRDRCIAAFAVIACTSIIIVSTIAPLPVANYHPFALVATITFGSALVIPRFRTLAMIAVLVNAIYWPTTTFAATSQPALIAFGFMMTVTTFSIVFGAFAREKLERNQAIYEAHLAVSRREAVVARDTAINASRAKSNLLANVSHELRTPLNAIIGFSEIMNCEMFGKIEPQQYREYVNDIYNSGRLLHTNIDDLLDISRLEVGKMRWRDEDFPLSQTVLQVVKTCQPSANGVILEVTPALIENDVMMLGDSDRISQVLINVITNAIKFSKPEDTVRIDGAPAPNGDYVISIADEGCGIAAVDLKKIREPFGQADRNIYRAENGGLGLGLSIVSRIVDQFGGTMTIDSKIEIGTTVALAIPGERISITPIDAREDHAAIAG